jgi:DNA-binding MarR family transcriptional regulator
MVVADLIHEHGRAALTVEQVVGVAADAGDREVGQVFSVRAPHGNVFAYLDKEGTQVSELARRAQITKQSMAELVAHLERHGYVERVPDPADRRAKLVRATPRGREVYAIARETIADIEREWTARLGATKMRQLRALLAELNDSLSA